MTFFNEDTYAKFQVNEDHTFQGKETFWTLLSVVLNRKVPSYDNEEEEEKYLILLLK